MTDKRFKIALDANWFQSGDTLKTVAVKLHWFWRMLGFRKTYSMRVLSNPRSVSGGYEYDVEMHNTYLSCLWGLFRIKFSDTSFESWVKTQKNKFYNS